MEILKEFLNDIKVSKNLTNEILLSICTESDLSHFKDKIFSTQKSFDVMVYEMKKYKLLEQPIMPLAEFENEYKRDERTAVSKLFCCYIPADEWNDLKRIIEMKGLSYKNLYAKQIDNIEQNVIFNPCQTIL